MSATHSLASVLFEHLVEVMVQVSQITSVI